MTMRSRDLLRLLRDHGRETVAQRGSHMQLKHPTKPGKVTLPHPKQSLHPKTVASVLRQAGIER